MAIPNAAVSARGITKRFPGVTALSGVDLDVRAGEVHVLVGENGAGKSTLVKVLAGIETADRGELWLSGQPYRPSEPTAAIARGVRVVHQELALLGHLSIAENLFLERLPSRAGFVDYRRLHRDSRDLLARVGLGMSPRTRVGALAVAQMQLVEIARAISAQSRVLILDEPTASLTSHEAARLFGILRQLRAEGAGILYISHHLEEVFEIGDRVTVLRNGQHVATRRLADIDTAQLVRMMVGRSLAEEQPVPGGVPEGRELLRVEGLRPRGLAAGDISFTVRAGEILGVAGLIGAGRTETMRAIFGADGASAGRVYVDGKAVRIRHPRDAVKAGVSFVPEDRKSQGLILEMNCGVNITLADLQQVTRAGLLQPAAERSLAGRLVDRLGIRTPSLRFLVRNLSGGNQQKVVLARWLFRDSAVLIVDEPTRGVDVGARYDIYRLLADLAARGKAIVMVSSDLPELLGICHRMLVFSRGRIAGELARDEFDQERVLTLAFAGYLGGEGGPGAAREA